MSDGKSGLQLRTLLKKSGELELSLVDVPTPEPADDEVVVRVEAAPINPSDLGLLVGAADMSTAKASGSKDAPVITAKVPDGAMRAMGARLDQSLPVGNEGAGIVIKTGASDAAKALTGKRLWFSLRELRNAQNRISRPPDSTALAPHRVGTLRVSHNLAMVSLSAV